jgi:hypothetical protein
MFVMDVNFAVVLSPCFNIGVKLGLSFEMGKIALRVIEETSSFG